MSSGLHMLYVVILKLSTWLLRYCQHITGLLQALVGSSATVQGLLTNPSEHTLTKTLHCMTLSATNIARILTSFTCFVLLGEKKMSLPTFHCMLVLLDQLTTTIKKERTANKLMLHLDQLRHWHVPWMAFRFCAKD